MLAAASASSPPQPSVNILCYAPSTRLGQEMSQEQGTTVLMGSKMLLSDESWEQTEEASGPECTGLQATTQL